MTIRSTRFFGLSRLVRSAGLALGLAASLPVSALAARSTFRTYGVDQGLAGLSGYCMAQDPTGYILVCSEHGVFEYDGRRFVNLGPEQGLPEGQIVYNLATTPEGRVAVGYAGEVFVSDAPTAVATHASALRFHPIKRAGLSFYGQKLHQLTVWHGGLVLLTSKATFRIAISRTGEPQLESMGYNERERALLGAASTIYTVNDHLWEAFADGRLCIADPGAVRCFGATDGLTGEDWIAAVAGSGSTVLFRSALSVATFDPTRSTWRVVRLPDQGTSYLNYHNLLCLFRSPAGEVVTPSDHGLDVLGPYGWQTITVADGAPEGTIIGGMTDTGGQLWLRIEGRGLLRWLGYGEVDNLQAAEGLSTDVAWQTAMSAGGALWVATDTAIDRFVQEGRHFRADSYEPGASFAISIDAGGKVWASYGTTGVRIIDPLGGLEAKLDLPPVDIILPGEHSSMWIGTEHGLFLAKAGAGPPIADLASSAEFQVSDAVADGGSGVFYLADGRLRRHRADGADLAIDGAWPGGGFNPEQLALERPDVLWAGGSGGLFRLLLSADRVVAYQAIATSDIRINTVNALTIDHRGWIWVGTSLGVSVFDGHRWASFDTNRGLVSDDIDQGGIREDPDGSVWVATSAGISHLLDPPSLFLRQPLRAVISAAAIGSRHVGTKVLPFTEEALTLQFGTPNYEAERSIVFRYQLSGVDAGWVDSASGTARYAYVPPGRHVLTVMAVDALSDRVSPAVTLEVRIGYPWWRRWWSVLLWCACAAGLIYGAVRIRTRELIARQRQLQSHIDEATAQLRYLATHDDLTGLLNRYEVERRLAARLSKIHESGEIIVALIDLDHFKQVNDQHGHLGGDDVLRALGGHVSRAVRSGEDAGRYGGEEVLVVLDDADGFGSKRILDLHRSVRYEAFKAAGNAIHVTCSIGLAWARAGDTWETLVGRADEALYQAKRTGRDRIVESRNMPSPAPFAAMDHRVA